MTTQRIVKYTLQQKHLQTNEIKTTKRTNESKPKINKHKHTKERNRAK